MYGKEEGLLAPLVTSGFRAPQRAINRGFRIDAFPGPATIRRFLQPSSF